MKKLLSVLTLLLITMNVTAVEYETVERCFTISRYATEVMSDRQAGEPKSVVKNKLLISIVETAYTRPLIVDNGETVRNFGLEILTECLTYSD